MWRFYCHPLGLFLLIVVGAEREDFQSNIPERTEGTAVTKYGILVKTNTVAHGREAAPTQTTHRGTEDGATAEFPKANVFDTELKPTNEGMQTTAALQNTGHLLSSSVQNSLNSSTAYPSESKVPLKSNSGKISLSSPQAALALNNTFESNVYLSADAIKAPPWFHDPHTISNHRNANSVIPTSADAGLLFPILSASYPPVIDNLTELFNDSDDKQPRRKSITNLGGNVDRSGTPPSILLSNPAEDSMKRNAVTDFCLTCLKDRKGMSSEKFVVQPAASPQVSSGFLSLTTSSHSFHPLSAGENNEIKDRNNTKDSILNHTLLPFTLSKTESQTVSFVSQIAAEMSSVAHSYATIQPSHTYPGKTIVKARLNLTSTAEYPSSKSLYTDGEPVKYGQEVFNKNVSTRKPQSNLMHFTESKKKASHSLSTYLKNQDISSGPVSNGEFIASHSSFNGPLPKGHAAGAASHTTARMNLIEALGAITPFTLRGPTASTVKNLKSGSLTARAGAFMSVSSRQTKSKSTPQTKQSVLTLSPKVSTISLASVTHRFLVDTQDSQTFSIEDSSDEPSPVNLRTTGNMTPMIKLQTSMFATRKVTPVSVFVSRSGLGSGKYMTQSTLTRLSSRTFTKKQNERRYFEGNLDVTTIKSNGKLIFASQKDVFSVGAENEDTEIRQTKSNHSREMMKTDKILTFNEEDEILENKRETLSVLDNHETAKMAQILNSTAEANKNTYGEAEKMKGLVTKTSRQEHVTLRRDKELQHGEVKKEGDTEREDVTKINTEDSTLGAAGKQREVLEETGVEPGNRDDIKFNKDIGKEDVTNVPLEPATNWKERNRDKEGIVEKLSSCHGLIKELEASEHKGIHLGGNASQVGGLTNKSFYFEVTSNRQLPHLSVRPQAPNLTAELPKGDIKLPLKEASPQEVEVTFPATAVPKLSESVDVSKVLISPSSGVAKTAYLLPLPTQFQKAQSRFTVNRSPTVSIIHSITDYKFNHSVLTAEPILHKMNEQGHAGYVTPSIHQQMSDDSSAKPPTVTALSSEPRISVGTLQPHRGQSAAQRNHSSSSSSCSNTTPGRLCSSRLSEEASHPDTLHTPAVENKQRFSQSTFTAIPAAGINRLPLESVSAAMTLRTFRGDRLTVTDKLRKLTGPQQANFASGSNSSVSLLATTGETNQSKNKDDVMMTLTEKHPDGVTGDEHVADRSKHVAASTDEFSSTSLRSENETKQNDLFNAGGKDEANNIIMTPKHHRRFELEDSTADTQTPANGKFGHVANYVDTNDQAVTAAFFQTDYLPERRKIQSDDELYPSVTKHHVAKTTERHNSQSLSQQSNSSVHIVNSNLNTDLTLAHQIPGLTRLITPRLATNPNSSTDFVSLTATPAVFREDFKFLPTTSATLEDRKKTTQNGVEPRSQPYAQTKPLTRRESPITHSSDKLSPAVSRIKTMETHSVQEQPKQEILAQAAEQGQHAPLSTTALSHTINTPESEPLKMAHKAGEAYGQPSAAAEQMSSLSPKGIKSAPLLVNIYGEHSKDRVKEHKGHTLPETTSISQAVFGHLTDFAPPVEIPPTEFITKTSCRSISCAKSSGSTKETVIDYTEEMHENRIPERNNFQAQNANETESRSIHRSLPGKHLPQAMKLAPSSVTSKWEHDHTSDDTVLKQAKSTSDQTVHLERKDTPQRAPFVMKTTQRRIQNTSRVAATEGTLSESGAAAVETTIMSTEQSLPAERNAKTQLDRRAGRARMPEERNASRSPDAQAKEETAGPQSGSRLLVSEPQTKSELPRLNQRRRTSPHQYVSGVTEISDDLCGSGNYTAEMRLKLGRSLKPGDVVPAQGNLSVMINLKTNNSQINLGVTYCCLSPTLQLDFTNSTCRLLFGPAAEPSGIALLPSALSTSASFTISLFQMINYSVVYLHCDLSVCLRNHSACERQCLQQRSGFPSEGDATVTTNLRNRISFGPVLKQAKNSTFPTEIDLSELDLVLVFVSLVVGLSLVSVMLLLVWLAYHRRAIWLLRSAAPSQACCGCLRPGGDLISP